MGGLGNGRRGGRSPSLMIATLIACILVLGFNYWVSSSRNLELQTKLYELEGQVRRGTAERGAAELKKNEFQGEIIRQKEQIVQIEDFYKRRLDGALDTCSQEKLSLQQNVSTSTKTIQELKGQLNQLNDDLEKLQKELQSCQGNVDTLNNKLTFDMTHCNSQVLSQKELCDERVAVATFEIQKKLDKLIPHTGSSKQEKLLEGAAKGDESTKTGLDGVNTTASVASHTTTLTQTEENEALELQNNNIIVEKDVPVEQTKDLSNTDSQSVPSTAQVKKDTVQPQEGAVKPEGGDTEANELEKNNLTEDTELEVLDAREEGVQTDELDPGMEGMLIGQGKAKEAPVGQKADELEDYDAEEQILEGVNLDKQEQNKRLENIDKDMEEELADYNGDDENEGEFEADKQAELAQV